MSLYIYISLHTTDSICSMSAFAFNALRNEVCEPLVYLIFKRAIHVNQFALTLFFLFKLYR